MNSSGRIPASDHRFLLTTLTAVMTLVVLVGLPSCGFEGDLADPAQYDRVTNPIVHGTTTSDYPAVGALYIEEDYTGGWGRQHFCSGTLIAPQWVITAAHCLYVDDVSYWMTSFWVGPDIDGSGHGYTIDAYHPYPDYDPDDEYHSYDLGLVHLAEAVPAAIATPIPHNTYNLSSYDENPIRWVGYGINNAYNQTGGGIKRTGTGYIDMVWPLQFTYTPGTNDAMPCSGDSGGATLMDIQSAIRVVGVISAGDQYCETDGVDTRVDAYRTWIEETIDNGGGETGCDITGGDCGSQTCFPVEAGINDCFPSGGRGEGAACDADPNTWTSSIPCADGLLCVQVSTNVHDGQCFAFCTSEGDCSADETCYLPIFDGIDDIGVCVEGGGSEVCDIAGGDCDPGEGCFPSTDGNTYCFASDELGLGEACDADMTTWGNTLPCDDGLICMQMSTNVHDGRCLQLCTETADCDEVGGTCDVPVFDGLDDIGVCLCEDKDNDGYCVEVDCNDNDRDVHPGATESCDDTIDNNCDGQTNEGCGGPCTDNDHDTFCAETDDCDDSDFDIRPGMPESCGDDIDNDCDGATDETCGCTDVDNDGYCAEDDCNDTDLRINPGAGEICDDGIDNNCNYWQDGDDWDYCGYPEDNPTTGGGGNGSSSGSAVGCLSVAGQSHLGNGTGLCLLAAFVWLGVWARPRRRR